jgi:photosystem II stability/assembly factor-like uncharacterized protein
MKKIIFILLVAAMPLCAQNFWEQIRPGSANDGAITTIVGNQQGDVFAGFDFGAGGLYRSSDHGVTWKQIDTGLTRSGSTDIVSLALDSIGNIFAVTGGGVYRSTNNGNTWLPSDTNMMAFIDYASITVSPNGNIYFWCDAKGLYRSTDDGTTWDFMNDSIYASAIAVTRQGTILVTKSPDNYRSTDSGKTWELITDLPYEDPFNSLFITRKGDIFAGMFDDTIFRSTDDGITWVSSTAGAQTTYSFTEDKSGYIYAACNIGVLRTTNDGVSWDLINSGLLSADVTAIGIDSAGYLYAGTADKGIFRSVQTTTAVQEQGATPTGFTLEQNYPNPFSSATTFRFQLPQSTPATLKIYNGLGQCVVTLLSERLSPAVYTAKWNAATYPAGVYYARLQAGVYTETEKVVVIK